MLAFSSYSPVFVVVFNFILFVLSHDRNNYSLLVTSAADIGLQTKLHFLTTFCSTVEMSENCKTNPTLA